MSAVCPDVHQACFAYPASESNTEVITAVGLVSFSQPGGLLHRARRVRDVSLALLLVS